MRMETSLVAQSVKSLPAVPETRLQSLGGEDSLEKGMAVLFPGESHRQRGLTGYSTHSRRVRHD